MSRGYALQSPLIEFLPKNSGVQVGDSLSADVRRGNQRQFNLQTPDKYMDFI